MKGSTKKFQHESKKIGEDEEAEIEVGPVKKIEKVTASVCRKGMSYRSRINGGKVEHDVEVAEHELIEEAIE